jgi:hypothetical protein
LATFPSVADFIEEADVLGRNRESTIENICGASTSTLVFVYDAQKRLIRRGAVTFTAWDARGRPTQESSVAAAEACPATATFNSPGGPYTSTETDSCAFDTAGHALRCTTTSNNGTCSVVTTYASDTDFVEEAGALGRYRRLTIDTACGTSESKEIFTYDGQKRLIRHQRPPSTYDVTFTAWDALGRPTQVTTAAGACPYTGTIMYNETARTVTKTYTPSTCAGPYIETFGYDGAGNVVSYSYSQPDFSFSTSYALSGTAQVCL